MHRTLPPEDGRIDHTLKARNDTDRNWGLSDEYQPGEKPQRLPGEEA